MQRSQRFNWESHRREWYQAMEMDNDSVKDRAQDARNALEIYSRDFDAGQGWSYVAVNTELLWFPYRQEKDRERLAEGLRRAGMQEY